ncbi:phage distal tail protein, Rcc01695 family [Roseibium sp.]|uniref:phage distal tail protein, Rcc01695 family n=1 Tax=Roseibium sp. TaxID=1936156 RepID=UPI003B528E2D
MEAFLNENFPGAIAFGVLGGPEWRTEIVQLATGYETRNARWADSRRRYDAATGIRSLDDLKAVVALFEKARGRLYGFRLRDPFDHSTAPGTAAPGVFDQSLGSGDGTAARFPLIKTYGSGVLAYSRDIRLPVTGTVRVALDGIEQSEGTDFQVEEATGDIVFNLAPATDSVLTGGFLFDVPVRFDTDRLDLSLTHFEAGDIPSIPLIEIRL